MLNIRLPADLHDFPPPLLGVFTHASAVGVGGGGRGTGACRGTGGVTFVLSTVYSVVVVVVAVVVVGR